MALARKKILAHLKKNRLASARELARALKMSAPNVRHHLSVLCADGRVELIAVQRRTERGRPEKKYALSENSVGDNLSALTQALFVVAGPKLKMEALAGQLMNAEAFANLTLQKRLALLIEKLNEMNYQARWEAGMAGPRLIFGHCPYAKVLQGHPNLCQMDALILRRALGREILQIERREAEPYGACPFVFQVA
ncbi:MAG: winged helix-turn-helix transcriptional regulator [Anaerolineales bacterium]|nr:winged helix-turn-helix transcriptional regulator [Anaerolineales bacterium]